MFVIETAHELLNHPRLGVVRDHVDAILHRTARDYVVRWQVIDPVPMLGAIRIAMRRYLYLVSYTYPVRPGEPPGSVRDRSEHTIGERSPAWGDGHHQSEIRKKSDPSIHQCVCECCEARSIQYDHSSSDKEVKGIGEEPKREVAEDRKITHR